MNAETFFQQAFQRNIGLLTPDQQSQLQHKTVGVVGLGGVGGSYVLSLVRLGVGRILISDFDHFEIANMNRQSGATFPHLGQPKVEAIKKMAQEINPFLEVEIYPEGIHAENVSEFVNQCDVIIDAIDFYCIDAHRQLHQACHHLKKYALFSIPLGFSATLQVFDPQGVSFEDYYSFRDCQDYFEKVAAFALASAPKGTHWSYLQISGDQLAAGTPPSLHCAVSLCTGFVISSTLLILMGQWNPNHSAPFFTQVDSRTFKMAQGRLRWGNRGPLQRFKRWLIQKKFHPWRRQINERGLTKEKSVDEVQVLAV